MEEEPAHQLPHCSADSRFGDRGAVITARPLLSQRNQIVLLHQPAITQHMGRESAMFHETNASVHSFSSER